MLSQKILCGTFSPHIDTEVVIQRRRLAVATEAAFQAAGANLCRFARLATGEGSVHIAQCLKLAAGRQVCAVLFCGHLRLLEKGPSHGHLGAHLVLVHRPSVKVNAQPGGSHAPVDADAGFHCEVILSREDCRVARTTQNLHERGRALVGDIVLHVAGHPQVPVSRPRSHGHPGRRAERRRHVCVFEADAQGGETLQRGHLQAGLVEAVPIKSPLVQQDKRHVRLPRPRPGSRLPR
mmetsp:Transcript_11308/g.32306  ORF Transcript_11308/g.32306 Transcript_11308/m.32306 type:complete len:236 (+) Transcript_11308:84-791(+)